MKHLKLFNDTASYEAWKNGKDYVNPAVSYVEENDTVFFEAEDTFAEDELLYYYDGTHAHYKINLTTLKVEKKAYNISEEDVNMDENGNIVINLDDGYKYVPGGQGLGDSSSIMYWTSESVSSIPMNFEYTLYDASLKAKLSGEFNKMVTFKSSSSYTEPNESVKIAFGLVSTSSSILEIKSKISNKTHRIKFE